MRITIQQHSEGPPEEGRRFLVLRADEELPIPVIVALNSGSGSMCSDTNETRTLLSLRYEPFADLNRKQRLVEQLLWRVGAVVWPPEKLHDLFPYSNPTEIAELFAEVAS